jgi:hypothetical protein
MKKASTQTRPPGRRALTWVVDTVATSGDLLEAERGTG